MKVIIVCENYYPSLDATSKRMRTFAEGLIKKGHEVRVLASETSLVDRPDSFKAPSYITYYSVFGNQGEHSPIRRLINNASGVVNSYRCALKFEKCDVVICTSPPLFLSLSAIRIARKKKAKYVFDIRDIWPDIAYEMGSFSKSSIYGRVFSWIARESYNNADLITVVSPSKLSKLQNKISSNKLDSLVLIENGLDLEFLKSADSADCISKYDLLNNPACVYIGKLGFAQGLERVLDIAKARPSSRFLLFGSGAEENKLKQKIQQDGIGNIKICGRISAEEAKTVLTNAKCAIVPLKSSAMRDSIPTKLYESLGCGCPTLLLAQGDSTKLLNECGLGYAAPPEDIEAVLAAFDEVVTKEWTANERLQASKIIRLKHSRQYFADQLAKVLDEKFN